MRRIPLSIIAGLAAAAAAALPAAPALACSCERNPTAAGILARAGAVFTGVAVESRPISAHEAITTFHVSEAFKRAGVGQRLRVRHPSGSSASCGVQFVVGVRYTLAAYGRRELGTNLCATWMFQSNSPLRDQLIRDMRERRSRR